MASVLNQPFFQGKEAVYTKLESIVWPNVRVWRGRSSLC